MESKKKGIIIGLCVAILLMVVGYSAFSSKLKINGTANIASSWNVLFTKIEEVSKTDGVTVFNEPIATETTATFNAGFLLPGDKIIYNITLENRGTLDAIIESINAKEMGSDVIYFKITGIKKGDILNKGTIKNITIEMGYNPKVTGQPVDPVNHLVLDIKCVQNIGQGIKDEPLEIEEPEIVTLSGTNNLPITNGIGRALANYKIYGKMVQNGTPSMENPSTFTSLGDNGSIEISSYNKNLYAFPKAIDVSVTDSYYKEITTSYKLDKSTTYTLSFDLSISNITVDNIFTSIGLGNFGLYQLEIKKGDNLILPYNTTRQQITFTTPSDFKGYDGYLAIRFVQTNTKGSINAYARNIQLEKGSSATNYHPRHLYTINLEGHDPLRSINEYQDYIDFENKRIVRYIAKLEFDGTETWFRWNNRNTDKTAGFYFIDSLLLGEYGSPTFVDNKGRCSHFSKGSTAYAMEDVLRVSISATPDPPYISIRAPYLSTGPWKEFLASEKAKGTPVTVYYVLKKPIYEEIDLPNVLTTMDEANIEVMGNLSDIKLEASYYKQY